MLSHCHSKVKGSVTIISTLAHLQDIDDCWHVLKFGFFIVGVHHKYRDSFHHLGIKDVDICRLTASFADRESVPIS